MLWCLLWVYCHRELFLPHASRKNLLQPFPLSPSSIHSHNCTAYLDGSGLHRTRTTRILLDTAGVLDHPDSPDGSCRLLARAIYPLVDSFLQPRIGLLHSSGGINTFWNVLRRRRDHSSPKDPPRSPVHRQHTPDGCRAP